VAAAIRLIPGQDSCAAAGGGSTPRLRPQRVRHARRHDGRRFTPDKTAIDKTAIGIEVIEMTEPAQR
jgi:hypothetical protein